jgi:two-component system response regulator VicR
MKKKIMIVDDEPDQILTVKVALEDMDEKFEIIGADSGMQCLELLKNNQIPDLILLDVMMPEMTGWNTYDRIKENEAWRKIPIVFLTARTDRIAKDAGDFLAEDYIEKPFNIEDLKERIDKVLMNGSQ